MKSRHLLIAAALSLGLTACLRLDTFVYRPVSVEAGEDLLAESKVPEALRKELTVDSTDGVKVYAYLFSHKAGDPSDTTPAERHGIGILYAHGQNNHVGTTLRRIEYLWNLGYTVLAYDARGYGKTQGDPTEQGHYDDAAAALTHLESVVGREHVALYGRSLGTLFVTRVAAERKVPALLLESPVLSIGTIIDDSLTLQTPPEWYVDSTMDNGREVQRLSGTSLLIMHGTVDDYVQPKYGDRLHTLAEGHAAPVNELWRVDGADHGNVPCKNNAQPTDEDRNGCPDGVSDDYNSRVSGFIDARLLP